jgi:hypothetical protein
MLAESEPLDLDGELHPVWTGYLTHLMRDLGKYGPYYSKIKGDLEEMDCIRQLRRGGGSTPSQWLLVQPPTEVLYSTVPQTKSRTHRRKLIQNAQLGELAAAYSALEIRVSFLERVLEIKLDATDNGTNQDDGSSDTGPADSEGKD